MLLAINSQEDSLKLQADLQRLQVWERDCDMSFNPDKCEVLRIRRKTQDIHFNYTLHGTVLRTVTSARYLGVHLATYRTSSGTSTLETLRPRAIKPLDF